MPADLPKFFMITGADPKQPENFLARLTAHLNNGVKLIQLRAKELSSQEYELLARKAQILAKQFTAKIILNTDPQTAVLLDADGLHLSSRRLLQCDQRPLAKNKIVSASCHNLEQLKHAQKIKVDFVTLSPVAATKSHPDAIPLGWKKFAELCQSVRFPVYALGGLSENDLAKAQTSGAHGIAAISALWDKNNSIRLARNR